MEVFRRVELESDFTAVKAAVQLNLSSRHVKRLLKLFREEGPSGLISRNRGRPSNRKTKDTTRLKVLKIIDQRYPDFSFTLISEMLEEEYGIKVSRELIRQWLIRSGKHKPRKRKKARVHQPRDRRPRFGELIQIDGSHHKWFEDRGQACTLIAFIDDATSSLLYMRFVKSETTRAYMEALRTYLLQFGLPLALYSDRHSIFRKACCERLEENRWSQFERAVCTLDIEMIHANSPQAKGRIERSFGTHQDRLVKLLRLHEISNIEDGNLFLEQDYMKSHNQKFSVDPFDSQNAHRPLILNLKQIDLILTEHHQRKISKNLTVQFENCIYRIITKGSAYSLRGSSVTVIKDLSENITILYKGKKMDYEVGHKSQIILPAADKKSVQDRISKAIKRKKNKPKPDHPWRHMRI